MHKKYKYRFKTEEEFNEENGDNWRSIVIHTWSKPMDYLLGTDIDFKNTSNNGRLIYYNSDGNISDSFLYTNTGELRNIERWRISPGMVKKVLAGPNYEPKKFIYV